MNLQSRSPRHRRPVPHLKARHTEPAAVESLERRQLLSASISGNVYNDLNVNAVFKAGDPELHNVRVYVDTTNAGIYKSGDPTALTNTSGNYTISGLTAGPKIVRQVIPAGFRQSQPGNGVPQNVTLSTSSSHATSVNFGDTQKVRVSGYVYADTNKNFAHDSGEAYRSGVTVFLDANGNGILDAGETSTTTNSLGYFVIGDQAPGKTYIVSVDLTGSKAGAYAGWIQTQPLNSEYRATLSNGQTFDNLLFGIHAPAAIAYNAETRTASANVGKNTQTFKSTTTGFFNKKASETDPSLAFGAASSLLDSNISTAGIQASGALSADAQFDEDFANSDVDVTFTLAAATVYHLNYSIVGNGFGFELKKLNNGGGDVIGPNEGIFSQQNYSLTKGGTLAAGKYELIFTNNSTSSNPFATTSFNLNFAL